VVLLFFFGVVCSYFGCFQKLFRLPANEKLIKCECMNLDALKVDRAACLNSSGMIDAMTSDFYSIARRAGTDKVTIHAYQSFYGLHVGPRRYEALTLFEIGLGCNEGLVNTGASVILWREFLPKARIHILEFDHKCTRRFEAKPGRRMSERIDQLFTGDQSNFTLLEQISATNTYDIIVDDGGHTRKQIIHSLIGLWPSLRPRGVYVIEDTFTTVSNDTSYIDYEVSPIKKSKRSA
jgi:hypothetical protein